MCLQGRRLLVVLATNSVWLVPAGIQWKYQMLSITVPGNRAQMKKNSWVTCKCLPVVWGNLRNCFSYNYLLTTSLMVQWIRIFPQETQIRFLVQEVSTCHGTTKTVLPCYWDPALEPTCCNPEACTLEPEEDHTANKPGTARNSDPHLPQLMKVWASSEDLVHPEVNK